jgi:hypothetical protein
MHIHSFQRTYQQVWYSKSETVMVVEVEMVTRTT